MDQPGVQPGGFCGQHSGSQGVDGSCPFGFRLGLVDGRMGGGVDHHVRSDRTHAGGETGKVGEIAAQPALRLPIESDDAAQGCKAALQFPADLSAFAKEQDVHPWRSP